MAVTARAKTVVKVRTDTETDAPQGVMIPDHIDILVSPCMGATALTLVPLAFALGITPSLCTCAGRTGCGSTGSLSVQQRSR